MDWVEALVVAVAAEKVTEEGILIVFVDCLSESLVWVLASGRAWIEVLGWCCCMLLLDVHRYCCCLLYVLMMSEKEAARKGGWTSSFVKVRVYGPLNARSLSFT